MGLPNRDRIAAFGAVLALRTALKRASAAERAALAAADRRESGRVDRTRR